MKTNRRGFLGLLFGAGTAGVGLMTIPRPASASAFIGATEVTQILNNIQLVASYLTQASQLLSLINQEKMAITNLVHNGIHSFADIAGFVNTASTITQGGLALAWSAGNLDTKFAAQFPGFAKFSGAGANGFVTNYLGWMQTNRDTLMGTMRAMNLAGQDLSQSQSVLAAMQNHASGSQGAQQMLETLGEYGQFQVSELQKLRQLMLTDAQSKNAFYAQNQQMMDTQNAARTGFFSNGGASNTDFRIVDPITGVH